MVTQGFPELALVDEEEKTESESDQKLIASNQLLFDA
jgi:hypothetical protein